VHNYVHIIVHIISPHVSLLILSAIITILTEAETAVCVDSMKL